MRWSLPWSIKLANTAADLHDANSLRYRVYVEEQRRILQYADHQNRIIKEPLDADGMIFVARDREEMAGTVRCNWLDGDIGYYREFYDIEILGDYVGHRSTTSTKMIV